MGKYSKKLVSKCIYLNILQATEELLLDEFYKETGWNLVCSWLTEAVHTKNFPLAEQILSLLLMSPVTVDRLKRNNMPKMVKDLSKDCPHIVSSIIINKKSLSEEREAAAALSEASSHDVSDMEVQISNVEKETPLPIPKLKIGRGRGSPGRGSQRGVCRGRARRKRGSSGDIDSTYSESQDKTSSRHRNTSGSSASSSSSGTSSGNSEEEKPSPKEGAVPPLRITIRNGVKVLRTDSNEGEMDLGKKKRPSIESTDSDDNKPLSIIKEECQKSSSSPPPQNYSDEKKDSNLTNEEDASVNDKKGNLSTISNENVSVKDEEDDEEEIIKKRKKGKRGIMIYGSDDDDDEEAQNISNKKSKLSDEEKQIKLKREPSESEPKKKKDDSKVKLKDESEIKENEKKRERKTSNNEKNKIKVDKDEKRNKDKEKYKERDKERDKDRSKHKSSKDRDKDRDRERDKDKDRNRDKYRDREKERDRDKDKKGDKKREKERRRDSYEKDRDNKRKEQLERDKATLDKVKPLSTQGLSKIPRKTPSSLSSPKSSSTPVSFLDALGSADSELEAVEGKRSSSSSIIKTKSRGFRNTGLLDETIKPPGVAGKRTETVKQKPSALPPPISSASSSTIKASPSSAPPMGDRPGGVKLISPKRPTLSDDGGFMAALTAAGVDRKKIVRKRKSSDSEKSEANQSKILKSDNAKDTLEESKPEEDLSPNENCTEEEASNKTEEKENILSPTSVKPTFNFYKETLSETSVKEETKSDSETATDTLSTDETPSTTSSKDDVSEEASNDSKKDKESMEVEESADANVNEEPMEIAVVGDGEVEGENNSASGIKEDNMENNQAGAGSESDFLDEAPVPAPAQEDYEKVEVTFAPAKNLKGVLVYHRPQSKKKKGVKWKAEADLKEVFFFPMDETERVNVNTIKFNEMMMMEKAREKELMFGKNRNRLLIDGMNMMDNGMPNNCIDYGPYKLYPVHLPTPSNITPGAKSVEKQVQAQREHATMATFFHPAMLPDSPVEPDPEMVTRVEPVIIPLKDVTGSDSICDNRGIPWPEPLLTPPDFPYMGASTHMGASSHQAPPQHGGGHWVLGNHTVSRFSGGPSMFPGHGAPQGPGTNPGFIPPPQGYPGDMRGGWGGPSDFGGPPVLMPNGPPPMGIPPSIGGPNMHGGPPLQGGPGPGPGPGPGMGIGGGPPPQIGNRDNYPRYRRGGNSGKWGGHQGNRGYCKHFRIGKCRHGDDCKFIHAPS
ncbi:Serine/threonine-protein phosphatase 1 regulatory subunit 10 [Armadillidium vulgare]|nr:Serine/threonine-protein phosphatase 1 regulatory subunit 10 [Armadillidium vulgare]